MKDITKLLDEIEERANKATPGNWNDVTGEGDFFGETMIMLADTYENWREDVAFIASARTDVPALVKALRRAMLELHPVIHRKAEQDIVALLNQGRTKE